MRNKCIFDIEVQVCFAFLMLLHSGICLLLKCSFLFNKKEEVYLDSPVEAALLILHIHDS